MALGQFRVGSAIVNCKERVTSFDSAADLDIDFFETSPAMSVPMAMFSVLASTIPGTGDKRLDGAFDGSVTGGAGGMTLFPVLP